MRSDLRAAALKAREQAYAPYSNFRVGAALLAKDGRVFSGVNVENVSLGLTMCAERVCIGSAIGEGQKAFAEIAIVADSAVPIVPCGACRQVLAEFAPDLLVTSSTLEGKTAEFRLSALLPLPSQGILDGNVPRGT